jgi:hypothetical protein
MDTTLCDWNLEVAGVEETSHVYLYAVNAVDAEKRRSIWSGPMRSGGSSAPPPSILLEEAPIQAFGIDPRAVVPPKELAHCWLVEGCRGA